LEAVEKEIDIYAKKYPQHNEVYLWLAEIYIANDDTEKAIELFNKIIAKGDNDKNSLDARTSLAQINFIKGDKESAKKAADSVLEISPNNTQALFIQAAIAADVGDYKTAIADLRKIIHSEPKEKKAYKLLSEVFLMQGHNDLAIETLNQLIDIDPTNSQSLVRLSQLYSLNGDNDHAIKILNTVNEKDPNYAIGWENTARLAIIMKDPAAMKLAIENLDKIEGQEILSIFLKGELASLTGKEMYAFSSYSKVIEADPSSPMAEHALYSLIKEHSKPDELQMVIDYIATLKTDSPYVSTILGECYIYLGKIDLAKTAFNKAIINNPKNQSPYIHLAKIYLNEKKNDEAIAILKTASEEIPNDASASLIQAGIFLGLGQYDKSIEIYDSILKTNQKVNEAANNMASIIADYRYTDPIMLEKAQRIAERFEDFKNPLFLDTLGWVYYRQGKFDKALKIIERSIEINPKASQEIHYHYGVILLEEGDIAKAKEELLLATEENANYATLDEAKKLLKKITISE
ncbi:MAG: tetratricopeptide repeat protein, partial [Rickettsiales bacterium]